MNCDYISIFRGFAAKQISLRLRYGGILVMMLVGASACRGAAVDLAVARDTDSKQQQKKHNQKHWNKRAFSFFCWMVECDRAT